MKNAKRLFVPIILAVKLFWCCFASSANSINVIPQPSSVQVFDGECNIAGATFRIDKKFSKETIAAVNGFAESLKLASGKKNGRGKAVLVFELSDDIVKEGYAIDVSKNKVSIKAADFNGVLYAIETIKQLLPIEIYTKKPCDGGNWTLPYMSIEDQPRFSYRGLHLDVARHFFDVDQVKKYLDIMAIHKLNTFHWHLTDDQGWRIEIKKYPLLTQKGSKRSHTNFNHKPHGGFYTQEDIKSIVNYCHKKHIKVIPEFDIPGHNVSSIACYPHLACFERDLEVATHWGVKRDILCAGKETTYQFVYDVLDEIMELFPDKIIHIGGDEAFKERWKICPNCQKAIKENGLRDEDDLQMFFMTKIDKYLQSKGYSSIMWGNDTKGGTETLSPDIAWTVYKPENLESAINPELQRGRKLINTKNKPYYLDFPYGWNSLKDVCNDSGALTNNDSDTMGLEASMWTEYVPNMKKLEFLTFPRLGAISEKAWSPKGSSTFSTFTDKTDTYYKLLDAHKIGYAPMNKACPSFFYKHASSIWFKRRVFHWERLHIALDNKKVKKIANKQ